MLLDLANRDTLFDRTGETCPTLDLSKRPLPALPADLDPLTGRLDSKITVIPKVAWPGTTAVRVATIPIRAQRHAPTGGFENRWNSRRLRSDSLRLGQSADAGCGRERLNAVGTSAGPRPQLTPRISWQASVVQVLLKAPPPIAHYRGPGPSNRNRLLERAQASGAKPFAPAFLAGGAGRGLRWTPPLEFPAVAR